MLTDTHCHLTYSALADQLEEVLAAADAAGVTRMVTIGTDVTDSLRAQALSASHPQIWFTAGIHPLHSTEHLDEVEARETLMALWRDSRCVALGEMGFDQHYGDPPLAWQLRAFELQLAIAAELPDAPLVLHSRKAVPMTLAKLAEYGIAGERCVFHCFTENEVDVKAVLDYGAWVGFTGIVTFNSAPEVAAASDRVPLDRLLIETDSPYLTPVPFRKVRPNAPQYVSCVADFLADRRGIAREAFYAATHQNASRFYSRIGT